MTKTIGLVGKVLTSPVRAFCSIPGISGTLAVNSILRDYLDKTRIEAPLSLSLDSFTDYITFVPKALGNTLYMVGKGTFDFGNNLINKRLFDSFSSIDDIVTTPQRVFEKYSFADTEKTAQTIVDNTPEIILTQLIGAAGLYTLYKLNKKQIDPINKNISKRLLQSGLVYGTALFTVGELAKMYDERVGGIKTGYSILSTIVKLGDYASGFLTSTAQAVGDYLFGHGMPDTIGLLKGETYKHFTHILEKVEPFELMEKGFSIAAVTGMVWLVKEAIRKN